MLTKYKILLHLYYHCASIRNFSVCPRFRFCFNLFKWWLAKTYTTFIASNPWLIVTQKIPLKMGFIWINPLGRSGFASSTISAMNLKYFKFNCGAHEYGNASANKFHRAGWKSSFGSLILVRIRFSFDSRPYCACWCLVAKKYNESQLFLINQPDEPQGPAELSKKKALEIRTIWSQAILRFQNCQKNVIKRASHISRLQGEITRKLLANGGFLQENEWSSFKVHKRTIG